MFVLFITLVVCGTQLGNYAVEIIQMNLESAWIYEIHHFPLKFVSIYRTKKKCGNYIFHGNFAHFGH